MAYSKFFSGDLPELLNEVIQYFHYDYKTLHSCILVNRLWCRLAIPLLWEDPFSIKSPKNYHFIEIYLHNLSDDDKTRINKHVIHDGLFPSIPSNTLFNYPKFIRRLNTRNVYYSIKKWISTEEKHSIYLLPQMSYFTKLIFRSLFLIFIGNKINLHSFNGYDLFDEFECDSVLELILQNPNFVHNIKNLTLEFGEITDNVRKFLGFLCSNCNSISSFYFLFSCYEYQIIEENLSQMIKFQENLKKISFCHNNPSLYLLLSLKNPNCSNTLNTIIFHYTNFENINVLSEVFNQLNVLESIHIVYCCSLDSKFIQQINNITKPFKLKSLFLDQMDELLLLELLIQKSGNYLENFGIVNCKFQQLIQSLKLYCNNIKLLYLSIGPNNQNINLAFDLIKNMRQNLNYLKIDSFRFFNVNKNIEISSIILQNLGQILPFKLEYLNLGLAINGSDLEVFLKNSQNIYIKKLLIRKKLENAKYDGIQDILPYIKEYIMKKKRVKYLAILESFHRKGGKDLYSLKDKVKEFQLHDIQVLNYNDLDIDVYDFINKTY